MITGGMGFVGSHLSEELLKNNHKIIVVTKSKKKIKNLKNKIKQIVLEEIDVTDFTKIKKCMKKLEESLRNSLEFPGKSFFSDFLKT